MKSGETGHSEEFESPQVHFQAITLYHFHLPVHKKFSGQSQGKDPIHLSFVFATPIAALN